MINAVPITQPQPMPRYSGDSLSPSTPMIGNDFLMADDVINPNGDWTISDDGGFSNNDTTTNWGDDWGNVNGGGFGNDVLTTGSDWGIADNWADVNDGGLGNDVFTTGGDWGSDIGGGGDWGGSRGNVGFGDDVLNAGGDWGSVDPMTMPVDMPGNILRPGSSPGSFGNVGFVGNSGNGILPYPLSTPAPSNLCSLPQSNIGNVGTNLLGGMLPPNQVNNNNSGMMQLIMAGMWQQQNTQPNQQPNTGSTMGVDNRPFSNPFAAGPILNTPLYSLPGVSPILRESNFSSDNGMLRAMNFNGDNGRMRPPVVSPDMRRLR